MEAISILSRRQWIVIFSESFLFSQWLKMTLVVNDSKRLKFYYITNENCLYWNLLLLFVSSNCVWLERRSLVWLFVWTIHQLNAFPANSELFVCLCLIRAMCQYLIFTWILCGIGWLKRYFGRYCWWWLVVMMARDLEPTKKRRKNKNSSNRLSIIVLHE